MAVLDAWALRRMNIPEHFWGASYTGLADVLQTPVANYCRKIDSMLSRGAGFYIHGPSGTGKSSAGVVLLKAAWERNKLGYYTTVKDLRQAIREDYTFDGDESVMARCKEVDVLVLDDLALDDFKNFTLGISEIEHLLTTRFTRSKTTVLATRLTPDALRTEYPSILQTMHGNFVSLACNGQNLKKDAADALRRELGVG